MNPFKKIFKKPVSLEETITDFTTTTVAETNSLLDKLEKLEPDPFKISLSAHQLFKVTFKSGGWRALMSEECIGWSSEKSKEEALKDIEDFSEALDEFVKQPTPSLLSLYNDVKGGISTWMGSVSSGRSCLVIPDTVYSAEINIVVSINKVDYTLGNARPKLHALKQQILETP